MMRCKVTLTAMACVGILALGVMPARADVINWALQGVTFSDGGTASGNFSTDSVTGDVVGFNVTTTAGTKLGGTTYDASVAEVLNNFWTTDSFDLTQDVPGMIDYLELAFVNPLNVAATDPLNTTAPRYSYECVRCYPARLVTAGEAVVLSPTPPAEVPEPATAAVLLAGLLGLGFARAVAGRPFARIRRP